MRHRTDLLHWKALKAHSGCSIVWISCIGKRRNFLNLSECRKSALIDVILIYTYLVRYLAENVSKETVFAEVNALRANLLAHADNVDFLQRVRAMIDLVEDDLIEGFINSAEEMIVRSDTDAGYMRAERSLIDRTLSAVEYAVHDTAETSVLMCMNNSDTAIMISADKEVLAAQICRKVISSHTANVNLVDSIQITGRADLENDNALIRD